MATGFMRVILSLTMVIPIFSVICLCIALPEYSQNSYFTDLKNEVSLIWLGIGVFFFIGALVVVRMLICKLSKVQGSILKIDSISVHRENSLIYVVVYVFPILIGGEFSEVKIWILILIVIFALFFVRIMSINPILDILKYNAYEITSDGISFLVFSKKDILSLGSLKTLKVINIDSSSFIEVE